MSIDFIKNKLLVSKTFSSFDLIAATDGTIDDGKTPPTAVNEYRCRHKGREFELGEILLSINDCEIWICRNDTIGFGRVEVFEYVHTQ